MRRLATYAVKISGAARPAPPKVLPAKQATVWPWPPTRRPIRVPDQKPKTSKMADQGTVTIAIEGCCHGELDNIYRSLQHLEQVEGKKIDLLISCGDFQAVRNMDDLETMACPAKYRDMQSFYKYYGGEKKPPFPTLFIGGNHEASNHLWELYYGGWAAPDIMFLGFTGCLKFAGLRIAGLSGIYKQGDYTRGHSERLPYDDSSMRSIYHVRDFEVYRLMQMQQPVDIFLSHDWPTNIAKHGNANALMKRKTFLAKEIESGELGSPANERLLHALQPSYWFSAHLHTKFPAVVPHPGGNTTKFLALDKCLPGRDFLQVVTLPARGPKVFEYDPEWLAIMKTTHGLINTNRPHRPLPGMGGLRRGADSADVQFVDWLLSERGSSAVPLNFTPTAAVYDPGAGQRQKGRMPTQHVRSPQTVELLNMLELPYNLDHSAQGPVQGFRGGPGPRQQRGFVQGSGGGGPGFALPPPPGAARNPEEIDLDDEDDDAAGGQQDQAAGTGVVQAAINPEEIDLDDVASEEEGGQSQGQGVGGLPGALPGASKNPEEIDLEAEEGGGGGLEADPMFAPLDMKR